MFKLPRLTYWLDLGEWQAAYAGIEVMFHLNPAIEEWEAPWAGIEDEKAREKAAAAAPLWEDAFYYRVARCLLAVRVPGALTESGEPVEVALGTAESVWQLEHRQDFDPAILQWALRQYAALRSEWLRGELKNSAAASTKPAGTSGRA